MSEQLTDPFIWRGRRWVFLGADDVYALFDPHKYGLNPSAPSSACWNGFVVRFAVKWGKLFLDRLDVYCEDNIYPEIAGVSPVKRHYMQFRRYRHIHQRLKYSGTITIGRKALKFYSDRAFIAPHMYALTYELTFKRGVLQSSVKTSGMYTGF